MTPIGGGLNSTEFPKPGGVTNKIGDSCPYLRMFTFTLVTFQKQDEHTGRPLNEFAVKPDKTYPTPTSTYPLSDVDNFLLLPRPGVSHVVNIYYPYNGMQTLLIIYLHPSAKGQRTIVIKK